MLRMISDGLEGEDHRKSMVPFSVIQEVISVIKLHFQTRTEENWDVDPTKK